MNAEKEKSPPDCAGGLSNASLTAEECAAEHDHVNRNSYPAEKYNKAFKRSVETQAELVLVVPSAEEVLRDRLAELVEESNCEGCGSRRAELHREILRLRGLLREGHVDG